MLWRRPLAGHFVQKTVAAALPVSRRSLAVMASAAGRASIAVVGGGVSGLYCASELAKQGHDVTVFDLGKHCPGGRLTTRRTSWKGLQFDHGCQFVRPASDTFNAICQDWLAAGVLAPWQGHVVRYDARSGGVTSRAALQQDRQSPVQDSSGFLGVLGPGQLYVGSPSSDAITNHLASIAGTVRNDVRVSRAAFDAATNKWLLEGQVRSPARTMADVKLQPPVTPWNLGVFDGLVLADKMTGTPGTPGFVELSGTTAGTKLLAALSEVGSTPLLVLLLAYQPVELPVAAAANAGAAAADAGAPAPPAAAQPVLKLPFDAAAVANSDEIAWVCVDSAKPGRGRADGMQSVVAVATPGFAESLLERRADGSLPPQTPELLARLVPPMFAALQRTLAPLLEAQGGRLQEPAFVQVHRWGSALPARPFGVPVLTAESARLAACGDFCLGGCVENAVLSGRAAADALHAMLIGS